MIPTTSAEFEECRVCAGSGFSGNGSGYDSVCGECGGQKYMPRPQPSVTASEPVPGSLCGDHSPVSVGSRTTITTPQPAALPSEEEIARTLLELRGFGFYADPMEGGQDAYDISIQALEEARAILDLIRSRK